MNSTYPGALEEGKKEERWEQGSGKQGKGALPH